MDKKLKTTALAIVTVTAGRCAAGIADMGGTGMEGVGMNEIMKFVMDTGITTVLLIMFVWYFINRSRNDDNKVKEAYETAQANMEDYLMAESAKREEIIRQEAERREKLIRQEAEKRESILMASQDRMLGTLDNIAESLGKMEGALTKLEISFSKTETRLDAIERKVSNG